LDHTDHLGIGAESIRWAWPLAARAARTLADTATLDRLLVLFDTHPLGHQPPVLRAQHQLHAALSAADPPTPGQIATVADAVDAVRQAGNPYHHAHALIDYAEVLARAGADGVDAALAEVGAISQRLGCPPLRARAASVGTRYARLDAPS
jgi:hypothetical protein